MLQTPKKLDWQHSWHLLNYVTSFILAIIVSQERAQIIFFCMGISVLGWSDRKCLHLIWVQMGSNVSFDWGLTLHLRGSGCLIMIVFSLQIKSCPDEALCSLKLGLRMVSRKSRVPDLHWCFRKFVSHPVGPLQQLTYLSDGQSDKARWFSWGA